MFKLGLKLLFLALTINCCNIRDKDCEIKKRYYDNGNLKRTEFYKSNNELFLAKTFYRNSKALHSIVHLDIVNGDSVMKFTSFNPDSSLKYQFKKINGDFEGQYLMYHRNGVLAELRRYNDGKLDGKNLIYNKKGQLEKIKQYKDGELLNEEEKGGE